MSRNDELVAVVTGGSRGIGKGVARALAERGATVYIPGRSQARRIHTSPSGALLPGTIQEAAEDVNSLGGRGIAVACDLDFAKIVERLDKKNVQFVSVTQAFNTTTSMGRLTLNVLLSFAQFEREVTAECIRDKLSASRKKGIFMGGCPPLGYDAKDRKLIINEAEAKTVRWIFNRYIELGSVPALRTELEHKGIRTKSWQTMGGTQKGGGPWYIGPLRHILRNRAYVGDAVHKGTAYPGLHEPIIAGELFDSVQRILDANRSAAERKKVVRNEALLAASFSIIMETP